jgi:hypothetical protein
MMVTLPYQSGKKMNDPNLLRFLYGVTNDSVGRKLMWAAHMSLFSGKISYLQAKLHLINSAIRNLQEAKKLLEESQTKDGLSSGSNTTD